LDLDVDVDVNVDCMGGTKNNIVYILKSV